MANNDNHDVQTKCDYKPALENMNISKNGKRKINQYNILQAHFLPILKQLNPTYFYRGNYYSYYNPPKLYHAIKSDDVQKYSMMKTSIECIVPEYILQRLEMIYNNNKQFKPQVVYTTRKQMSRRDNRSAWNNILQRRIAQNNDMVKRYEYMHFLRIVVNGYCNRCFKEKINVIPAEIKHLIWNFYGQNVLDIFNFLSYDTNPFIYCRNVENVKNYLAGSRDIFICLSLHDTTWTNYRYSYYSCHYVIPFFHVKLDKVRNWQSNKWKYI